MSRETTFRATGRGGFAEIRHQHVFGERGRIAVELVREDCACGQTRYRMVDGLHSVPIVRVGGRVEIVPGAKKSDPISQIEDAFRLAKQVADLFHRATR